MLLASNFDEGPPESLNSATATMGNSRPLEACTVMMRTKSPSVADKAPGASFDSKSSASNCRATREEPAAEESSISSSIRTAL